MTAERYAYAVFHLNLGFSSLDEDAHETVLEKCYRPLLDLAEDEDFRPWIEAPATTLLRIDDLDPGWIRRLRRLVAEGRAHFIGSGYVQAIAPLLPARANAENLRQGWAVYERLLGVRPGIAWVNEQAYAGGLLALYRQEGIEAIVMEWNNCHAGHPEWPQELALRPQRALGADGETLPVIWNDSIAFQKLQRLAHGEITMAEYRRHINGRIGGQAPICLPVYGNDAEVFDFRPGRYGTEAPGKSGEWLRLREAFAWLGEQLTFAGPKTVLACQREENPPIRLESARHPVPVKKQGKYNLTRWAVTGRDDLGINTACWRIYDRLARAGGDERQWRNLLELWASDYRTHITERRWRAHRVRLLRALPPAPDDGLPGRTRQVNGNLCRRRGRFLDIAMPHCDISINLRRGLAIDALSFNGGAVLCGGIDHGYFSDIDWSADWYTGNLVLETANRHKVTDLEAVDPIIGRAENGDIVLSARIETPLGPIRKHLRLYHDEARIGIHYHVGWHEWPEGSLRMGFLTLRPESFDRQRLQLRTHNGGPNPDHYALGRESRTPVRHGDPVSLLVSARSGFGMTEGWLEIGDDRHSLIVETDRRQAALLPMLELCDIAPGFYCALSFSAQEMDETRRADPYGRPLCRPLDWHCTIRPGNGFGRGETP